MRNMSKALKNVFGKINSIQGQRTINGKHAEGVRTLDVLKMSKVTSSNPFDSESNETYDRTITDVRCIFNSTPEIITSNNNIMTQEVFYFYILRDEFFDSISFDDRILFSTEHGNSTVKKRYKPVEIDDVFNYLRIKAVRE